MSVNRYGCNKHHREIQSLICGVCIVCSIRMCVKLHNIIKQLDDGHFLKITTANSTLLIYNCI